MRTSWPLRLDRYTSSLGTARPSDCSSSARRRPRKELPGMYGIPNASLTTGLSAPPISSEPLPAPMWSPDSHFSSPSRISFPISFSSVCAVWELMSLFVVSDDRFEEVLETLVALGVILARHLQQELLQGVQAAERMARDRVGQAGAEHDELVLALVLRGAHGAADGVIQAAELALGAGIHVAHTAHDHVGLVIEVERISDQLVVVDFGRAFGSRPAEVAAAFSSASPAVIPAIVASFPS